MIKVGITGGHTRRAGQLIRLLLNHPDVVITAIKAPGPMFAGRPVASYHRSLIGETDLTFTSGDIDTDKLDVLFMTGSEVPGQLPEQLRVVNLTRALLDGYEYGLPELNRKALVRGATRANIPAALATAVITPLLPLARNLMLNTRVEVSVAPGSVDASLFEPRQGEIAGALSLLQTSLNPASISVDICRSAARERGTTVTAVIDTHLDPQNARELYTQYFDDHNLTHIVDREPSPADVIGTAKCLISADRDTDGRLRICSAIDGPLKGSAAQAVHVMNLLMGLAERTGLALPAFAY